MNELNQKQGSGSNARTGLKISSDDVKQNVNRIRGSETKIKNKIKRVNKKSNGSKKYQTDQRYYTDQKNQTDQQNVQKKDHPKTQIKKRIWTDLDDPFYLGRPWLAKRPATSG